MNRPFTKGNAKYDIMSSITVSGYEKVIMERIVVHEEFFYENRFI